MQHSYNELDTSCFPYATRQRNVVGNPASSLILGCSNVDVMYTRYVQVESFLFHASAYFQFVMIPAAKIVVIFKYDLLTNRLLVAAFAIVAQKEDI